jgi:CRP-like cAMP-binding protein
VCRHYTFVIAGCLKLYGVDKKGTEHILQFAAERDWISDIGSFHAEQPSQLYIEAIEPTELLQLEKPDLIHLYRHYPKYDRNFRVIIENKFVELQQRVLQNISSTAEERYHSFLSQYPGLASRLPNTQIAAYIGITPEFLSKLRKASAAR